MKRPGIARRDEHSSYGETDYVEGLTRSAITVDIRHESRRGSLIKPIERFIRPHALA